MAKKKFTDELKEQAEEVKTRVKGLGPLKITLLVSLAIVTILSYVFYGYIFGADNVFAGDFGSEFLNALMGCIPRIVRCIQIVTIVSIITTLILAVITKFFGKSQRSVTVARLCCNLIKWVVTVVLVIAVLAIWGVDTTALITGAGVLTLVVGLGMQSLIADVVAGLFIVFENEFNVGDIITVDGFRGEVIAIGIRTTKLKAVGNVKIFNNSDIRSVLNQTTEQSVARTNIDVEYGDSLPRIEEIIKEKLPHMTIEGAPEGVVYEGVSALGASGVTLQFAAKCYEGDIFDVQRRLNGRLKIMFDESGINIPFNQLVVHVESESCEKSLVQTVDKR